MCGDVSDGVHVHVFVQVHMLQATHNALIPPPPYNSPSFLIHYGISQSRKKLLESNITKTNFNGLLTANQLNVNLMIAQHCKVYLNNPK